MEMPYNKLFNKSIERVVLSSLIFQPELIEDFISEVDVNDFYQPFHRNLFTAIVTLYTTKNIVSEELIKEELEKKQQFNMDEFFNIFAEAPVSKLEYYIKELKDKSVIRKLLELAKNIENAIFEEDKDSLELLDYVESSVYSISQNSTTGGFKNSDEIIDVTEAYIEKMKNRENKLVTGVDTGFYSLNKMTTGFNSGDLVILAARPAMGKTAFALNIVNDSLQKGNGVAFFSLEMPVEQLMLRLLSIQSSVELQKLRTGDLNDDESASVYKTMKDFRTTKLFIDDDGGININILRTKLRKLKSKNPDINLAVIDYIQIMGATGSRDRQAEVSEISRGLKLLARELNMPILALSQLNRSLESRNDKRPIMSDIRESGAIEQDADIILFVYRDDIYRLKAEKEKEKEAKNRGEKYVSTETENPVELAEIIIGKQRNGPTGVVKLNFVKNLTKFLEFNNPEQDFDETAQHTKIELGNNFSNTQNMGNNFNDNFSLPQI